MAEVVLRDRQLTRVDKEALFGEIREALDRPLSPQEEERRELARLVEPHLRQFYSGTMPQDAAAFTTYNARALTAAAERFQTGIAYGRVQSRR